MLECVVLADRSVNEREEEEPYKRDRNGRGDSGALRDMSLVEGRGLLGMLECDMETHSLALNKRDMNGKEDLGDVDLVKGRWLIGNV